MIEMLQVSGLSKTFKTGGILNGKRISAVDDVSLSIDAGETLGLVGESGSGKSTTAKCILRLMQPDAGTVIFEGKDVLAASGRSLRRSRLRMQMVFQDPYSSLTPTMKVRDIVTEPLLVHRNVKPSERTSEAKRLLAQVGMTDQAFLDRYPHEFSGGQRQRIAIARAVALGPSLLICDEAVSALDLSSQAAVINLFLRMQEEAGLGYLFVSHDLGVVRHVSDKVAVMYLGRIVESGPTEEIYKAPLHPYTAGLLASVPGNLDRGRTSRAQAVLAGEVPDPANRPVGCSFADRCPSAMKICRETDPGLLQIGGSRQVACHLHTTSGT